MLKGHSTFKHENSVRHKLKDNGEKYISQSFSLHGKPILTCTSTYIVSITVLSFNLYKKQHKINSYRRIR